MKVTLDQLYHKAESASIVRAGSTNDPDRRRREYVYGRDYSGIMYYAKSTNMKESEDFLLRHEYRDNEQLVSNQTEGSGYVYLIKEE